MYKDYTEKNFKAPSGLSRKQCWDYLSWAWEGKVASISLGILQCHGWQMGCPHLKNQIDW